MTAGYDASLFERIAAVEERSFWFRARNRLIASMLRRHFPDARNLLEVGCGTGAVLRHLHDALPGLELAGTDLYEEALVVAHANVPEARFERVDATAMHATNAFDVVGAFDVLEHVERDDLVLAGMHRAARRGGGAIMLVPQHPRLWSEMDVVARHARRYTRDELSRKVRAAGFEIERTSSFVSLLLPAMVASRALRRLAGRPYDPVDELAPGRLNKALERVLDLERHAIERGGSLPFGGSLLLVARKA